MKLDLDDILSTIAMALLSLIAIAAFAFCAYMAFTGKMPTSPSTEHRLPKITLNR